MKTFGYPFKNLLLIALYLVCSTTGVMAQQTAGQRFEKALYLEEVNGKLQQAIDQYQLILKEFPANREIIAKSQLHLGICYEKLGLNQARENYQAVIDQFPEQLSEVRIAKERMSRLDSFTSGTTLKTEQTFRQAGVLFREFNYESAIAEYEKVIRSAPKSRLSEEAKLWTGQCYFKQGKYGQALASFNSIIRDFPESTIVPVTELMISQVNQAIASEPKKSNIITLDDKTILDPATGIRYTRIKTWAGKYDVIKSASSITDIAPNRKFLLADDQVISFDNSDPIEIFENPSGGWSYSRLSPDATKIAFMTGKALCIRPVSPLSGQPTGQAIELARGEYRSPDELAWSPNGEDLVLSLYEENYHSGLAALSITDHSIKPVSNTFAEGHVRNPVYSKSGSNILYLYRDPNYSYSLKMKAVTMNKSVTLIDSCFNFNRFILSPDNQWTLYKKTSLKTCLFRLADNQEQELSAPAEVGEFVSWTEKDSKVFFYRPSFEDQEVIKVASVFGGPALEVGKQNGLVPIGWTPGSDALISKLWEGNYNFYGKTSLIAINLTDQASRTIDGLTDYNDYYFSRDYSKIIVLNQLQGKTTDLFVLPFSLKDYQVTGEPVLIFKGFSGSLWKNLWSPDGKRIAVCTGDDIWICYADGSAPLQLTKTPISEKYPVWSPDGNFIAVFTDSSRYQIIRASDGEVQNTFEKVNYLDWTPDGKEIAIAFLDGQLNSISLASGKVRKIANWQEISHCPGLHDLKCSPDGKWIAINSVDNLFDYNCQIFLISTADGQGHQLAADDSGNKVQILWSPDSKWLAYYSEGSKKARLEGTLWEADLTDFMNKMKQGTQTGWTTDFDFNTPAVPAGGVGPDGTFTDTRDNHVYKYKKIGEQTWMAENLAFLPEVIPDSINSPVDKHYFVYEYDGTDAKAAKNTENYQKYGVLYNWPAVLNGASESNSIPSGVQGACPAGWHLPSDGEWMILERTLGMTESDLVKITPTLRQSGSVGNKLKSATGWEDDDILIGASGFNAQPGGLLGGNGKFYLINQYAHYWTSATQNSKAVTRSIMSSNTGIYRNSANLGKLALSVRCVKN